MVTPVDTYGLFPYMTNPDTESRPNRGYLPIRSD